MKFDQLIEYNIFFVKNHVQNVVEKLVSDHISKVEIKNISGSTIWSSIQFVFIVCPSRGLQKHIETTVLTTCFNFI